MGVRGLRHAERVTGIARPVVPLFVSHFSDTGEQFFIAGRRQVQSRPLFTSTSQARHRLVVPFGQLPIIEGGLAGEHIHRGFGLWHGDLVSQIVDVLRCCKLAEGLAIFLRKIRNHQRHIVFFVLCYRLLLQLCLDGIFRPLGKGCLLRFEILFGHLPGFLVLLRLQLQPVRPLVGKAVHGDEYRTAAHHGAIVFTRHLQPLGQIELFKQRTNGIRHVFDNLSANQGFSRWCRYPLNLDRLNREIGNWT